jgi:putative transcriptional regulator
MTKSKRLSRLAQAMLETAKDMRSTGILDEAAYNKITMRHHGVNDKAGQ